MTKFESSLKPQPQIKRPRSSNIIKDYSDDDEDSVKKKKVKKVDQDYHSREDSISSNNNSSLKNNKRLREKKPNNIIKELDNQDTGKKGIINPNIEISRKCERVFKRLKNHPLIGYFLNYNSDQFSLNNIEKKIKNNSYSSCYQFGLEIRGIWNYHFQHSTINSDIYQKTFTLSNFFEETFKDIENTTEEKSDIHDLQKKVTKLEQNINTFNKNSAPTNNFKRERSLSISDKPMTTYEKTQLGNNIKKLSHEQLKGIINILSDSTKVEPNSKYFEFDIETLPTKKLRELDKYVRNCQKSKAVQPPVQNQQNGTLSTNKETINKPNKIINQTGSHSHTATNNKPNPAPQKNYKSTTSSLNSVNTINTVNSPSNTNNINNTSLKRPMKNQYEEQTQKKEIINKDIPIEKEKTKNEIKRVEEPIHKEIKEIIQPVKVLSNTSHTNVSNTTIHNITDTGENKNTKPSEPIKTESIQIKEKEEISDSDSDSDSDSGKILLKSDSESLSELDLSKKTTNKVI